MFKSLLLHFQVLKLENVCFILPHRGTNDASENTLVPFFIIHKFSQLEAKSQVFLSCDKIVERHICLSDAALLMTVTIL